MSERFMTVAQTIESLENNPDSMKVKIVYFTGTPSLHGIVKFNRILVAPEKKELQFAYDNQKPRYHQEEHSLGVLLKQIKDLVSNSGKQAEIEKYFVCKREIGLIIPAKVTEETMYLKHIIPKKDFKSGMMHYDGIDDTIILEFMKADGIVAAE